MSFREYLQSHYVEACAEQHRIERDQLMIDMLRTGGRDAPLVKSWMRDYGLFQGITSHGRDVIVARFLDFARSHLKTHRAFDEPAMGESFGELFTALYRKIPRSWMSATSKLLWCLYPNEVAMYDSLVLGTLTVMQCIDDDLSGFPRIGTGPRINKASDISEATKHYINYSAMVRKLKSVYADELSDLRHRNGESYPYDIRIIDKLLWMIGNPKVA